MKDSPYMPGFHRISLRKEISSDYFLIRVNIKIDFLPGQFIMASISGAGEIPLAIASYGGSNIDLLVEKKGRVSSAICLLQKGDKIGLRGPYGIGFPVKEIQKRDLLIITEGRGMSFARSLCEYLGKEKRFRKRITLIAIYASAATSFMGEEIKRWDKVDAVLAARTSSEGFMSIDEALAKISEVDDTSVAVLLSDDLSMRDLLAAKGISDNRIYVHIEAKMHCAHGRCGHCMVLGKYICKEGPIFRLDVAKRMER